MATTVYVSNAEDGDISVYGLGPSGELRPSSRVPLGGPVMPLAISPDRRFLYAAVRSKPFSVHAFAIEPGNGALKALGKAPLAESCPYISLDHTGRTLLGASYAGHLVSASPVGTDGRVGEPKQVIPVGRNAHAIRVDRTNRFAYVPTLGTDQIFQFTFDGAAGRLASNTPALCQMKPGAGPRHFVISSDNRFLYALSELQATVTIFSLNSETGLLAELGTCAGLPADSRLGPGAPRGPDAPPRERDSDVWAADLHLTPDNRFLYVSERTRSTLGAFRVEGEGRLSWLASTPTEKQPRGFAIDPQGRFLVAAGEKSTMLSVHAIDEDGSLSPARRFPGGRGGNWVTMVAFD